MQIAILGPLQVRRDDLAEVMLAGAEERLLLAALAAGAPDVVGADLLAEILWDRHPPTEPEASLHDLVVGLRTTLEPGLPRNVSGRHVLRRGRGYVLALSGGEIDSLRFTTLAARGHARLAERDAAGAHRMFTAALRLWRGEPYADWPDLPFARAQRQWVVGMEEAMETAVIEAGRLLADEAPPPPQAAALPGAEPI